jgi:hypothetical protein
MGAELKLRETSHIWATKLSPTGGSSLMCTVVHTAQ